MLTGPSPALSGLLHWLSSIVGAPSAWVLGPAPSHLLRTSRRHFPSPPHHSCSHLYWIFFHGSISSILRTKHCIAHPVTAHSLPSLFSITSWKNRLHLLPPVSPPNLPFNPLPADSHSCASPLTHFCQGQQWPLWSFLSSYLTWPVSCIRFNPLLSVPWNPFFTYVQDNTLAWFFSDCSGFSFSICLADSSF